MKVIKYKERDWIKLLETIVAEHGRSINISWVCKEKLGFTVRHHSLDWDDNQSWTDRQEVHLDFHNEMMQTLFILRYVG